jgi:hypothetical protein
MVTVFANDLTARLGIGSCNTPEKGDGIDDHDDRVPN